MRVVINEVVSINDSVVRVDCYTYSGDINNPDNDSYRWYQLAIGVDTFLEKNEDGSMGILGDKFQEAVSNKIVQSRNVAELAHILSNKDLEWELNIAPVSTDVTTPDGVQGLTLAQG